MLKIDNNDCRHFDKTEASDSLIHYIKSISYTGSEKRFRKLSKLKDYLEKNPINHLRVAIIGPGSDIEIATLDSIYRNNPLNDNLIMHCFDISVSILLRLRTNYNLPKIEFISADAIALPCKSNYYNLVVSSSVEHEVYSYRGGIKAIRASISEYCRILAPEGILFLRDFLSPPIDTYVMKLESDFAMAFWDAFCLNFRRMYDDGLRFNIQSDMVILSSYDAIDFATHLAVKLLYDSNYADIATWKEINERYIAISKEWIVSKVRSHDLELLVSDSDREVEQEEIINQHISMFKKFPDGSIKKISPFCERFNLIFKKKTYG